MSSVVTEDHASGRVREIALARGDGSNAFTREVLRALHREIDSALADDRVTAMVVVGRGDAFCTGQDLTELIAEQGLPQGGTLSRLRQGYAPLATRLHSSTKPVVAAVNGIAAGAGLALAALCATRLASPHSQFVPGYIDLGLVPDTGLSHTLPALIGKSRSLRWLVDGRSIDATTALAWGLVDAVVPDADLLSDSIETADRLGSRDGRAVAGTEELIHAVRASVTFSSAFSAALDSETQLQVEAGRRPEVQQAIAAQHGTATPTERQVRQSATHDKVEPQ